MAACLQQDASALAKDEYIRKLLNSPPTYTQLRPPDNVICRSQIPSKALRLLGDDLLCDVAMRMVPPGSKVNSKAMKLLGEEPELLQGKARKLLLESSPWKGAFERRAAHWAAETGFVAQGSPHLSKRVARVLSALSKFIIAQRRKLARRSEAGRKRKRSSSSASTTHPEAQNPTKRAKAGGYVALV
mmetsp:Transcript_35953/g.73915  ORF Transcript_35953/g.73915 Transcript_35953/m.73915 type:complete len:187 (+) Transcript_35953:210-770(+)